MYAVGLGTGGEPKVEICVSVHECALMWLSEKKQTDNFHPPVG